MKKYKRSDKCELVYVSVAWNVLDEEQRKDVEYINSYPNKAGRIRECVRAMRTGITGQWQIDSLMGEIANEDMVDATDEEAINLLTS
ncbi:hypothetical protein DNHGIG_07720 [Collibacillus ludicampi]|uniref:Uncharacterized protein n=1 Tax=Collibacillus ludicampi TaxID=2771369 RepID=A0AAV4LC46_9BACL|nr:hypothetical protein [Collibacillus ludicampi]GIM45223.1 hypothetical protein DNHGIG_07720 [Collibacillus ludicampi]